MIRAALPRLYIITDRRLAPHHDVVGQLASVLFGLAPGAAMVQVREKDLDGRALLELTRAVIAVAGACGCPVLVNDRLDVAQAAGADGVHLPEDGLPIAVARSLWPDGLIGRSIHSAASDLDGADFAVFGPVWATASKPGVAGAGLDVLAEITSSARCPVLALGGVDRAERAAAARAAGAWGVAGIRAFLTPEAAAALSP